MSCGCRLDPLQALTPHTITDERVFRRTLEEARRRGWAAASDESELGVRSIAAPVFNHRHEVEAAINVAGHASRLSMKRLKEDCLPVLLETTAQISRALGAPRVAQDGARSPGAHPPWTRPGGLARLARR